MVCICTLCSDPLLEFDSVVTSLGTLSTCIKFNHIQKKLSKRGEKASHLNLFSPRAGLARRKLNKECRRRQSRGCVELLDVVSPLHASPVIGLEQKLQPSEPHLKRHNSQMFRFEQMIADRFLHSDDPLNAGQGQDERLGCIDSKHKTI